jgi:hypothetical protein
MCLMQHFATAAMVSTAPLQTDNPSRRPNHARWTRGVLEVRERKRKLTELDTGLTPFVPPFWRSFNVFLSDN